MLGREILLNRDWGLKPVGFVESVRRPHDQSILGLRIYDDLALADLMRRLRVEEVLFSGDSIETGRRQTIERLCGEMGVPVQELVFEIRRTPAGKDDSSAA